jgi:hypothetical protein
MRLTAMDPSQCIWHSSFKEFSESKYQDCDFWILGKFISQEVEKYIPSRKFTIYFSFFN